MVMARGLQTPMVVVVAGVICGTLTGGLIGLFVGPIVLAVFYDLVRAWLEAGQPAIEESNGGGTMWVVFGGEDVTGNGRGNWDKPVPETMVLHGPSGHRAPTRGVCPPPMR